MMDLIEPYLSGRLTSVYEDCVAAGVEMSNHYSDLYIPVNETTNAILKKYSQKSGCQAKTFVNKISKDLWYDVPFAYLPYWEKKQQEGKNVNNS